MDVSHPDAPHSSNYVPFRAGTRPAVFGLGKMAAATWLTTLVLAFAALPAGAQSGLPPGNAEKPIDLQAASSDFDYKNNALLFKRVKITQGELQVMAQQASSTGLDFDNSEWLLQGDVQIVVPGGKLQS